MEDEIKGAHGELQEVNIGGLDQSRPVKISKVLPEDDEAFEGFERHLCMGIWRNVGARPRDGLS